MKVNSEQAYYLAYGESDVLTDEERAQADDFAGDNLISFDDADTLYDDVCDLTEQFSSQLTVLTVEDMY